MPPARVCLGSLHGAETSFQLTLALIAKETNIYTTYDGKSIIRNMMDLNYADFYLIAAIHART